MGTNQNRKERIVNIAESWKDFGEKRPVFDYAEDMILFLTVLPALLVLPVLLKEPASAYWAAAALPLDFAALTAARLRAKHWWAFGLLVTGITAAFTIFSILARAWSVLAAGIVAALMCIHSLKIAAARRKKAREDLTSDGGKSYLGTGIIFFSFFLCAAVYFFALSRQTSWLMGLSICTFVAVCDMMLIYTHFFGENRFSQWEKATGDAERKPPKSRGGAFAFLVTVCCCAAAAALWLVLTLSGASRADAALLNFFRSRRNDRLQSSQIPDSSGGMPIPADKLSKLAQSHSVSPVWAIIGTILKIVLTLVSVAAVVLLAVAGIRALFRLLGRASGGIPEERRSIFPGQRSVKAAEKKLRRTARDLSLFARGSNRIKIRRMFLAFVRRHRFAGVAGSDAPMEIVRKIGGDSLGEAATLYELARYGKDECGAADVSRMRESLRPAGNGAKRGRTG